MKHTYLVLLIALLAIKGETYAQGYATDALRFSQYEFGSTARIKALGNAQTAMGGDLSSISGNPAGLGLYTKSEFAFTPELMNYNTTSTYFNQSTDASRGQIGISNVGAVFAIKLNKFKGQDLKKGALSLNFGIGYSKTANFGNKILFSGINNQNSIANFYADLGNSAGGTSLEAGSLPDAAFESNLINYNNTYRAITNPNPTQEETIIRKGAQSEFNLAAGLNVGNKLYFGAAVGILGLNYSSDNTFTETGTLSYSDPRGNYQENYANNYYQRFEFKGTGVNAKFGMIFRPSKFLRLGANIQSPNWYTIDDNYSESLRTRLTNNPYFTDQEVRSQNQQFPTYTYNLRTPAKLSLGAALLSGKIGFITGDVDFIDYSSMELSQPDSYISGELAEDNRYIVNNYKNAINYRLGAELKAGPQFMLRAGYGVTGSPMENSVQDLEIKTYSFGGGYRAGNLSLDVAFINNTRNSSLSPYLLDSGVNPVATSKNVKNGVFITLATRF
ncbi:OmpP1/FadL family transporter [Desertivirga brevis]|uniref:OmpP1/FadL family transporter n=1 Tax=Desertivirga brevis TaxID=2810310 RepID=UPI001A977CB4|nr:outer membrane protein transport protein [Pedobacter sp. SYSU D00873]